MSGILSCTPAEMLGIFRGDHLSRVESSWDPNVTVSACFLLMCFFTLEPSTNYTIQPNGNLCATKPDPSFFILTFQGFMIVFKVEKKHMMIMGHQQKHTYDIWPWGEKTRVGLCRTEVSVRLDGIVFCALSFGHGPRGQGFEGVSTGVDFHVFWGAVLGGSKQK